MDNLHLAEVVLAGVIFLLVGSVAFMWLRRRYIGQGRPLLFCALRSEAEPRWRLGFVRFRGDLLEWFSVVGPRLGPERVWVRHELDLGVPRPAEDEIPGIPAAVAVPTGTRGAELAMSAATYTAVRAWHESSPPGFNVNVA